MVLPLRKVTLTVITRDNKILLGMKKRGFGAGHWNGFGGKLENDESLIDCVCRETEEEAKIILPKDSLELVAILDFYFTNKPLEWNQQVWVYKSTSYEGTPGETEEMQPKLFSFKDIPYNKMWPDDIYWLPKVLEGKKVRGEFTFAEDGSVAKKEVRELAYFKEV